MSIEDMKWSEMSVPAWSGSGGDFEFEKWSILTKTWLKGEECAGAISTDWSVSVDTTEKKADAAARLILLSRTRGAAFDKIKWLLSARDMWERLQYQHGSNPKNKELILTLLDKWSRLKKMK